MRTRRVVMNNILMKLIGKETRFPRSFAWFWGVWDPNWAQMGALLGVGPKLEPKTPNFPKASFPGADELSKYRERDVPLDDRIIAERL